MSQTVILISIALVIVVIIAITVGVVIYLKNKPKEEEDKPEEETKEDKPTPESAIADTPVDAIDAQLQVEEAIKEDFPDVFIYTNLGFLTYDEKFTDKFSEAMYLEKDGENYLIGNSYICKLKPEVTDPDASRFTLIDYTLVDQNDNYRKITRPDLIKYLQYINSMVTSMLILSKPHEDAATIIDEKIMKLACVKDYDQLLVNDLPMTTETLIKHNNLINTNTYLLDVNPLDLVKINDESKNYYSYQVKGNETNVPRIKYVDPITNNSVVIGRAEDATFPLVTLYKLYKIKDDKIIVDESQAKNELYYDGVMKDIFDYRTKDPEIVKLIEYTNPSEFEPTLTLNFEKLSDLGVLIEGRFLVNNKDVADGKIVYNVLGKDRILFRQDDSGIYVLTTIKVDGYGELFREVKYNNSNEENNDIITHGVTLPEEPQFVSKLTTFNELRYNPVEKKYDHDITTGEEPAVTVVEEPTTTDTNTSVEVGGTNELIPITAEEESTTVDHLALAKQQEQPALTVQRPTTSLTNLEQPATTTTQLEATSDSASSNQSTANSIDFSGQVGNTSAGNPEKFGFKKLIKK